MPKDYNGPAGWSSAARRGAEISLEAEPDSSNDGFDGSSSGWSADEVSS